MNSFVIPKGNRCEVPQSSVPLLEQSSKIQVHNIYLPIYNTIVVILLDHELSEDRLGF